MTTVMEHHSNLVPWQRVCDLTGASLKVVGVRDDGTLDLAEVHAAVTGRTRLVACTHVSNGLGTIDPVQEIERLPHEVGALFFVDGAQSVPHMPVYVKELKCDLMAFSGHKMLAPMGIGVLYARKNLLADMAPFLVGGGMVTDVTLGRALWADLPLKFEAGTPNVCGAIALGGATDWLGGRHLEGAVDYLQNVGMAQVLSHERELVASALQGLRQIDGVRVLGPVDPEQRSGVVALTVWGSDAHLVARLLNDEGIAVRSGDHCGFPLAERLGVRGAVRVSFYIYNTLAEVAHFVEVLDEIVRYRLLR